MPGDQRGEGELGPDRGQPQVAGSDTVVPVGLEMVQERRDRGDAEVVLVEPGGRFPAPLVHEDLWRRCYFRKRVVRADPVVAPGLAVEPRAAVVESEPPLDEPL